MDTYLQLHPPAEKVDFDNALLSIDHSETVHLPSDQFDTMDDIHIGAENSIRLALGAFFLALDTALEKAGRDRNPRSEDSFQQLRVLIYMCRCAFAHNVLAPHWEARGDYARKFTVTLPGISIDLDLKELSGKHFEVMHMGGYSQIFRIKGYVMELLAPNQALLPPRAVKQS